MQKKKNYIYTFFFQVNTITDFFFYFFFLLLFFELIDNKKKMDAVKVEMTESMKLYVVKPIIDSMGKGVYDPFTTQSLEDFYAYCTTRVNYRNMCAVAKLLPDGKRVLSEPLFSMDLVLHLRSLAAFTALMTQTPRRGLVYCKNASQTQGGDGEMLGFVLYTVYDAVRIVYVDHVCGNALLKLVGTKLSTVLLNCVGMLELPMLDDGGYKLVLRPLQDDHGNTAIHEKLYSYWCAPTEMVNHFMVWDAQDRENRNQLKFFTTASVESLYHEIASDPDALLGVLALFLQAAPGLDVVGFSAGLAAYVRLGHTSGGGVLSSEQLLQLEKGCDAINTLYGPFFLFRVGAMLFSILFEDDDMPADVRDEFSLFLSNRFALHMNAAISAHANYLWMMVVLLCHPENSDPAFVKHCIMEFVSRCTESEVMRSSVHRFLQQPGSMVPAFLEYVKRKTQLILMRQIDRLALVNLRRPRIAALSLYLTGSIDDSIAEYAKPDRQIPMSPFVVKLQHCAGILNTARKFNSVPQQ